MNQIYLQGGSLDKLILIFSKKEQKNENEINYILKEFNNSEYFKFIFHNYGMITLHKLIMSMYLKEYQICNYILIKGDFSPGVYFILEGKVFISNGKKHNKPNELQDNQQEERFLTKGQVFGNQSVLDNKKR